MKFVFSLIFFLIIPFSAICQDIIYLKDGTNLLVTIVSIEKKAIRYKKPNGKGPVNEIAKNRVSKIQYESGAVDDFEAKTARDSTNYRRSELDESFFPNSYLSELPDNIISINVANFLIQGIGLSYERIFDDGRKSIRVPLFINMRDTLSFWDNRTMKNLETGFDFLFYPTGQGRLKYAVGPLVRFGTHTLYVDEYVIDPGSQFGYYLNRERSSTSFGFGINNFFNLMASNNLYLSTNIGLGVRKFSNAPNKNAATRTLFNWGFFIGYRF